MAVIMPWLLFLAAWVLFRRKRARARQSEVQIQQPVKNAGSDDACQIGVALAVLFTKIVDPEKFSEAELRRLAQTALQEALSPVLGGTRFECLATSFEGTYRLIRKMDAAEIHMDQTSSMAESPQDHTEIPTVSTPAVVEVPGARDVPNCLQHNAEAPAANVPKDSPRAAIKDCQVKQQEVEKSAESVQSAVGQSGAQAAPAFVFGGKGFGFFSSPSFGGQAASAFGQTAPAFGSQGTPPEFGVQPPLFGNQAPAFGAQSANTFSGFSGFSMEGGGEQRTQKYIKAKRTKRFK